MSTAASAVIVTAARNLLERSDAATAGLWPRATALLGRQALEVALAHLWKKRAPGMERCSTRAQLLCLAYFLGNERLAEQTSYAWAGLSRACHQHPYELPPTMTELSEWLATVQELSQAVSAITKE